MTAALTARKIEPLTSNDGQPHLYIRSVFDKGAQTFTHTKTADTRSHIYGRILDAFKRTNIAEQIGTLYEDPVRFLYSPMDTVEPTYQASHICVSSRSLYCFIRASRMSRASSLWFHPKMQKRYVRHRKWRRDEEKRRKKRATKLSLSWSLGYPTSSALPD